MISSLNGQVIQKNKDSIILDVCGVGYRVYVPENELFEMAINAKVRVWTHLAVKDDALDLYGSINNETVTWFKLLLHVKGVGAKSALSVLSRVRPKDLSVAIEHESSDSLVAFGVGKKAAERIVLELKTKARDHFIESSGGTAALSIEAEAVQALEALGYSREQARAAVKEAEGEDIGGKVRSALKILGRR